MSCVKQPSLVERIARELIEENGYTITHLEGGGAYALYLTAREATAKKVKRFSYQTLGRIVGSHNANHNELHREDTSIYEVNPRGDFYRESGRNQLRELAVMVIIAEIHKVIVSDANDYFDKIIRLAL